MKFSLQPSAFSLLFSRRWWLVTLLVLLLATVFVRLGVWQLDRLEQRRASNAMLEQALAAPATNLNNIQSLDDLPVIANQQVVATGEYDQEQQLLLKLQSWQGQPGVHLVTPLILNRGAEEGIDNCQLSIVNCQLETAVLVDRGWIPDAEVAADKLVQFEQPGEVTVEGYVALSQTLLRQADSASAPRGNEIFRVNVNAIAPSLPYELLPFYIIESSPTVDNGNTTLPYHQPREVDLSEGPHLGYAIQWFLFSLILVGGYIAYVHKRLT